ncbi:MAG: hypothetical protein AAFO94_22905, partial [Bacteroidota bacterium]
DSCRTEIGATELQLVRQIGNLVLLELPRSLATEEILRKLQNGGISYQDITKLSTEDQAVQADQLTKGLQQSCAVQMSIQYHGQTVALLEPLASDTDWKERFTDCMASPVAPDDVWQLSRFALLRRGETGMRLESPLSKVALQLNDAQWGQLCFLLGSQLKTAELQKQTGIDDDKLQLFLALLHACHFIDHFRENESGTQDATPLDHWSFHDLYFHSRTRLGRHNDPVGGNYRFKNRSTPPPVTKPPMKGPVFQLPAHHPYYYTNRDLSLAQV